MCCRWTFGETKEIFLRYFIFSELLFIYTSIVSGQNPIVPDHDLRSGKLLVPNGYMALVDKFEKKDTSARIMAEEMVEKPNLDLDELEQLEPDDTDEELLQESCDEELGLDVEYDYSDSSEDLDLGLSAPVHPRLSSVAIGWCNVSELIDGVVMEAVKIASSYSEPLADTVAHSESEVLEENSIVQSADDGGDEVRVDFVPSGDACPRKQVRSSIVHSEDLDTLEENLGAYIPGENNEPRIVMTDLEETGRIISDEINRDHYATPNSGPLFIFNKSHKHCPSTIAEHVNDLTNIFEVSDEVKGKSVIAIIADDGADYGLRSGVTAHYLGRFFTEQNLDVLIITKNAPGDSKHNPIAVSYTHLTLPTILLV